MKTLVQLAVGVLFVILAALSSAHVGGHGDGTPITEQDAKATGDQIVSELVVAKKLSDSWRRKELKNVSKNQTAAGKMWMVTYENAKEADATKRTLYIFLDESGNFIGGNHSGKH